MRQCNTDEPLNKFDVYNRTTLQSVEYKESQKNITPKNILFTCLGVHLASILGIYVVISLYSNLYTFKS